MFTKNQDQDKRKPAIIKGISRNMKISEIASRLQVHRWMILKDIKSMKRNRDPDLKKAYKTARERKIKKSVAYRAENRFRDMTGMTLKERTFINMLHYHRSELLKVLKSDDENQAIQKLSSSVKRCLKNNGIITPGWGEFEITSEAREYLSDPDHKIWQDNRNE
jgi:transposase